MTQRNAQGGKFLNELLKSSAERFSGASFAYSAGISSLSMFCSSRPLIAPDEMQRRALTLFDGRQL